MSHHKHYNVARNRVRNKLLYMAPLSLMGAGLFLCMIYAVAAIWFPPESSFSLSLVIVYLGVFSWFSFASLLGGMVVGKLLARR